MRYGTLYRRKPSRRFRTSGWLRLRIAWMSSRAGPRRSRGMKFATKLWRGSAVAKIIEFTKGARADFDQSFDWYAARSEPAAKRFATAVEQAFDKIIAGPDRFSATRRGCQYCTLRALPFRVVFHQVEARIVIVAVAHA